jgi:predicted PurR-regulated permease PerM
MATRRGKLHPAFYGLAFLIGWATLLVLKPYLSVMVLAFVVVTFFEGYYQKLYLLFKREGLANLVAVLSVVVVLLVPLIFFVQTIVVQVVEFSFQVVRMVEEEAWDIDLVIVKVNEWLALVPGEKLAISEPEVVRYVTQNVRTLANVALNSVRGIGSSSLTIGLKFLVFVVMMYILFPTLPRLKRLVFELSPFADRVNELYYGRLVSTLQALIRGSVIVTLVQVAVAALLLVVTGVPYISFWMVLMIILGVLSLPTGLVSVPIGMVLLLMGQVWQGLVVVLGSLLIVGSIDNVLKPVLVSKGAPLKPAWVLIGILGGVKLFGVMGLLYGPVILVLAKTTIEIYLEKID